MASKKVVGLVLARRWGVLKVSRMLLMHVESMQLEVLGYFGTESNTGRLDIVKKSLRILLIFCVWVFESKPISPHQNLWNSFNENVLLPHVGNIYIWWEYLYILSQKIIHEDLI